MILDQTTHGEGKRMFKVYDKVWIMYNNKPVSKLVFAVIERMNFSKTGTDINYQLVESRVGASWESSKYVSPDVIFATKEELLETL